MSTTPTLPRTQDQTEDPDPDIICYQEHKDLIETLPKCNGWAWQHLYKYNGFWLSPVLINSYFLLHTYFQSNPTDIFLASFMKTGTTWLKAIIFSTHNRHRYNFSDHHLLHYSPHTSIPHIDFESYPITDFTHLPEPRLFGTHFARTLLPPSMTSCKFVYVCRDPKDVLVSKWRYMSKLRSEDLPPLSLNEAFQLFCQGKSEYGPFWEHVLSYWEASLESPDKILFLKYEDMKKQPVIEVRKLASFMGKPFTAEEEEKGVVEEIVNLCSFENLSKLQVNKEGFEKFGKIFEVEKKNFFRKGEMGEWKNYLTEEMKQCIDTITNDKLKGSGLVLGSNLG